MTTITELPEGMAQYASDKAPRNGVTYSVNGTQYSVPCSGGQVVRVRRRAAEYGATNVTQWINGRAY